MLNDVHAIEMNVFHQRATIFTVENNMFFLARRATTLHYYADGIRRTLRGMRNVWRNEKRFALTHNMIDNAIAFANSHFNIALELIEILLRVDAMKIIPRIRPFDNHDEKIAPVVQVTIAHRRLEFFPVLLDPVFEINRRSHSGH
jgi:hypothetical protein